MTVKRFSKGRAQYTPNGRWTAHCALCRHYSPPTTCSMVAGPVARYGWCKLWQRAPKTG